MCACVRLQIKLHAFALLLLGVALVTIFSDPMVSEGVATPAAAMAAASISAARSLATCGAHAAPLAGCR